MTPWPRLGFKLITRPDPKAAVSFELDGIGTHWVIDLYETVEQPQLRHLKALVAERVEKFDRAYSRFRADSIVAAMSQATGRYRLPTDAGPMIEFYHSLYEATDGLLTPLIGNTISEAGYDAHYSLKAGELHAPIAWDEALSWDGESLTIHQPVLLDFGAAGKGYLVDLLGQLLDAQGLHRYCVDGSGDLLYCNRSTALDVGLEDPADSSLAIGVAHITQSALCGSATNRRRWEGYHHIIDPQKLSSPEHLAAVWVSADTAMLADGLSTALFFTPAQSLHKRYNFGYALLYSDGGLECSDNFPGHFFS